MRGPRYRILMVFLLCILMLASACTNDGGQAVKMQQANPESYTINNRSDAAVLPIISHNNYSYVSLDELVNVLELHSELDQATQTYTIGDDDVVYKLKVNSKNAEKEEQGVLLTREPILLKGKLLLSLEDIQLFQEYMNYEVNDQQLMISPNYNGVNTDLNPDLDFSDDPADPAGDHEDFEGNVPDIEDLSPADNEVWTPYTNDESLTVFTRKSVNANKLIATGKKYLGVKYKFGTGSYSKTKRFDCSSFVQQLYGTYGVRLPRTARSQEKYGISISRKNLRKGDLLYFYVPGRFKTNKTVGHLGIYIGNNQMLHSSPKPKNGVQITNINKAYWKNTYLGAKRVIK